MKLEVVTCREEFQKLETEWNTLLQRSEANTITLTHQWLTTWWDVFQEGRELHLIVVRDEKELLGIAPLLKRRVRHFGILPMVRLEFLASGEEEADEICSEYLDFILAPGREEAVLKVIVEHLASVRDSWDELVLTDVVGTASSLKLLRQLVATKGLGYAVEREQCCLYLPLPEEHEQLADKLNGHNRKRLKKDRKAARENNVQLELVDGLQKFPEAFDTLVKLHQNRWTSRGLPGSFASEKFSRFHRELLPRLLQHSWANLWVLRLDDEPLYALYDFVYGGKIAYYQGGMGALSGTIKSPGLLIRDLTLEVAIERGFTECDFLKGEISSYKSGWGAVPRPIVQVRVASGGRKERALQRLRRVVDSLRPAKRQAAALAGKVKARIARATPGPDSPAEQVKP